MEYVYRGRTEENEIVTMGMDWFYYMGKNTPTDS